MARILVIDDDEQVRDMLQQVYERNGYTVETAADGAAGLHAFRCEPADLVLTDLLMPGKEGLETIHDLLAEKTGVKIIAISGGGRLGHLCHLATAERLGADRVFAKPIDIPRLLAATAELLAG